MRESVSTTENEKVLEEQAKEDAARAKDETEIKQAENSLSKAKLEMQKVELFSRIEAEKVRENLDGAQATLAQLKETFDLKRKAESIAIENALAEALSERPEFEAVRNALANDETGIRLAQNQLRPDLSLNGFYQSSGLGGNQYNLTTGQLVMPGGFGSSFNQLFGFGFPGYGGTLTLKLPLKNCAGEARLGNALVSRTHDLYSGRLTQEQITRQVSDAVHQLEEAKMALEAGAVSIDLAQKSLAADQRKYELGAQTNFFVLDSQIRLAQAELTLLQAQINYQIALASVRHATGKLLEPYHLKITELSK